MASRPRQHLVTDELAGADVGLHARVAVAMHRHFQFGAARRLGLERGVRRAAARRGGRLGGQGEDGPHLGLGALQQGVQHEAAKLLVVAGLRHVQRQAVEQRQVAAERARRGRGRAGVGKRRLRGEEARLAEALLDGQAGLLGGGGPVAGGQLGQLVHVLDEDEAHPPEVDLVLGIEVALALDADAVDAGAVEAAQVAQPPALGDVVDLGMLAAGEVVLEDDGIGAGTPDRVHLAGHQGMDFPEAVRASHDEKTGGLGHGGTASLSGGRAPVAHGGSMAGRRVGFKDGSRRSLE